MINKNMDPILIFIAKWLKIDAHNKVIPIPNELIW